MTTARRTPRRRTRTAAATVAVAALALAGCGGSGDQAQAPTRALTVSAAASLTDVYQNLGREFEQANPGTTVRFNFGGSDTLAQQVVQGVPADVLATASTKTMQTAQQAGKIEGQPITYATNTLQIAVPPGDPRNIRTLADLAAPGVDEVVCAPAVPCGAATAAAAGAANVTLSPISEEQDVKAVLQRVITRNADAGVVYVTDVRAANGQVQGVDFPSASAPGATQSYPIGVVTGTTNPQLAQQWVQFVTGPQGKGALAQAGFTTR